MVALSSSPAENTLSAITDNRARLLFMKPYLLSEMIPALRRTGRLAAEGPMPENSIGGNRESQAAEICIYSALLVARALGRATEASNPLSTCCVHRLIYSQL